jgi:hypothetical protein
VSNETNRPSWSTAPLWGILAVLLVFGTVGAATFVYGILELLSGSLWGLAALALGGLVAVLAFLFMAGILYRVDRYRGANQRRVELFE